MKAIKKYLKSIALIFTMLILLQSCTIYKSVPVSLEEATSLPGKSKVYYKSGYTQKCKRIVKDDNFYRCLTRGNHKNYSSMNSGIDGVYSIDSDQVSFVNKENRSATTVVNVTAGVAGVGIIVYIIALIAVNHTVNTIVDAF